MANRLSIEDQIQEASFNLESYAFHKLYPRQPGPRDGAGEFARMQSKNYRRGVSMLTDIIQQSPITFAVGDAPLTIHDPLLWPYESIDDIRDDYEDDLDAARDYYRPTVSLLPDTEIILDTSTALLGPGEAMPFAYFGNVALQRLIWAEDLATALTNGGRIKV